MKTTNSSSRPVLSQTEKNTTLWIGHLQTGTADHIAGQIFTCPSEGLVDNIQVYSSSVTLPGDLVLTLHEFDMDNKTWGSPISSATCSLEREDEEQWISFRLQPITLYKNVSYGFRLQANEALIGLGEAATANNNPFTSGYEWKSEGDNQRGHYFTYFSLAYKIELRA